MSSPTRALLVLLMITVAAPAGAAPASNTDAGGPALEEAGLHRVRMEQRFAGARRSYDVRVPAAPRATAAPLVVVLHGAFSTGRETDLRSGFGALADREGIVALYPNGIGLGGTLQHWNAGHCCGLAERRDLDDDAFVLAAIDDVIDRAGVDPTRVYLVGYSNGGMLAHRLAAAHPERFAAVAVVAGTVGSDAADDEIIEWIPAPRAPLPVVVVHGDADATIAYDGIARDRGRGLTVVSAPDSARFWARANGCADEPTPLPLAGGPSHEARWSGCEEDATVALWTLSGWGHDWPSPAFTDTLPSDHPLAGFDLAARLWSRFDEAAARIASRAGEDGRTRE